MAPVALTSGHVASLTQACLICREDVVKLNITYSRDKMVTKHPSTDRPVGSPPMYSLRQQYELLETLISEHPNGLGIGDIEVELTARHALHLHRRTLQRRLSKLVNSNRILTVGGSSALLYQPVSRPVPKPVTSSTTSSISYPLPIQPSATTFKLNEPDGYITMSSEGAVVRRYVRQARMNRQPVGYQREFLDRYIPGETFYLPASLREQLHEIGCTGIDVRPAGTYARDILGRLLVDLSWASSRLEGNTYSRLDTVNLLEYGQQASGKDAAEARMILNHKAAIEFLVEGADDARFDQTTFLSLHALLSDDLLADPGACGRLRRRPVDISGSVFVPLAIPQVIAECFSLLLAKADEISDPFEQAFFLMVHLPYLQPFEDVNKRVSRVGANIPLIKHNLCPLSFVHVPEDAYLEGLLGVYELNQIELMRDVFVWAYERSCQQYLAVARSTVVPDPLSFKYRRALSDCVREIVLGKQVPTRALFAELANQCADQADRDKFIHMLNSIMTHLHEYSAVRYQLRPAQFLAWKEVVDRLEPNRPTH